MSLIEGFSFIAASLPPNLFGQMGGLIVLLVIVATAAVFLKTISKKEAGPSGPLAYQLRPSLLTNAERSFYGVLLSALAGKGTVFAKVRVSDIVTVPRGVSDKRAQVNRVNANHVDFVICDSATMRPIAALELDYASHERLDRQERDSFLAEVFACAKLPLIRVPAKHAYTLDEIQTLVEPHLPIVEERIAPAPPVDPRGGSIIVNLPPSRS